MNTNIKNYSRTREMVTLAVLSAMACIVMMLVNIRFIPAADFLRYDPKDVIITIGGFIFGPLAALAMTVVVALVEMFTVSAEGIIGFVMNVISSAAFACTASLIYKKRTTLVGAITGLVAGSLLTVAMMLLWNYWITPLYMGVPREAVAAMLLPVFAPFNLFKSALNASLTLLLYKPLVTALRKARMIPPSQNPEKDKVTPTYLIIFGLVFLVFVGVVWVFASAQ